MNVLQILPELNAGGVERTTLEVAEALIAAGHIPHVASLGGRFEEELVSLGGVLHRFDVGSKNILKYPGNVRRLKRIISENRIDIAHARSRAPAWPSHAAARTAGIPFVTTYHGIYNAGNSLKRYYNSVMAKGDLIIANSGFTRQHIISEHGTNPDIIRVIPRGVDMTQFDPANISDSDVTELKTSWDIPGGATTLLLPGRLTRWKGQTVAIKALEKLPSSCVLVCLGDPQGRDEYVAELWALAGKLGVRDRLRLPGHFSDMPTALSAANIVISASTDPEAFGRVAAEAQAMGRPVIATAHGGALETVIDGITGFHVKPGDAGELSSALIKALADLNQFDRKRMRRHVQENFSKRQLQEKTLAVYAELML